jgi:hypothetical protein
VQKERNPKAGTKPENPLTHLLTICSYTSSWKYAIFTFDMLNKTTFFIWVKVMCEYAL